MVPWTDSQYLAHMSERKEMTFLKWQRSGYADFLAWEEFILYFQTGNDFLASQK